MNRSSATYLRRSLGVVLIVLEACVPAEVDAPPGGLPAGVDLGAVVACSAPAATPTWTDVAEARGLLASPAASEVHGQGGLAVVSDLDADGDVDIATNYPDRTRFYVREGDTYTMLDAPAAQSVQLIGLADLRGDGGLQVLRGGLPAKVFELSGGEVTSWDAFAEEGDEPGFPAHGLFPADLDGDGAQDLFGLTTVDAAEGYVALGLGDGTVSLQAPGAAEGLGTGRGFDARWFDWDGDDDLDLYVVNDKGPELGPNRLFENDAGVLTDVSDACACGLSVSGMGVDVGDYDRDGRPDLFVTIAGSLALLHQLPDRSYVDVSVATGFEPLDAEAMGWGAAFLDIENDGDLDILEARGDLWDDLETDPLLMYDDQPALHVQNTSGQFSDEVAPFGLEMDGSWRAVVAWDDNADGVLDLLLTDVYERPRLLLSDSCTEAAWLDVVAPFGARVEVDAGGETQTAWITWSSGMGGGKPAVAHFGLGSATEVDALRVRLTDGTSWEVEGPIDPRRVVRVGM